MKNDLVFRAGPAKRTLGWLVVLGAAGALAAMIYAILTHPEAQIPTELWSAAAIGAFLVGLMAGGVAVQYRHWRIEGETIVFRHHFKQKTVPVSELAGFGKIIIFVVGAPFTYVDLHSRELKLIARLPVSFTDWPIAEAWLADRLRYVVNDGSPMLPKYRFADTPKR
jgi:hypothetical protein